MKLSVVIPTYNRPDDIKKTLNCLKKYLDEVVEILIIDQSSNINTKKVVNSFKENKIKYIYSNVPSITIARNTGVNNSSKESDIICFLDDDVKIEYDYFGEIKNTFKKNPSIKACAGMILTENSVKIEKYHGILQKIFFLSHYKKNKYNIISAYGNTYDPSLKEDIFAEWLPGVNMCYKKEVFDFQKFDKNLLGYTVAEDIDFSYRLQKKISNSMIITPRARIVHLASTNERYPAKTMSYVNQVDHFYFNFKNLNSNIKEKFIFFWSILGISILRTLNLLTFKKVAYLKWKYYWESLFYCIRNVKKIKKGKLREWKKEF
jgi:glycosyltransferase involved in cell wall biosynthesis